MALRIEYRFTPLRLVIDRKEPVQMKVTLTNVGAEPEKISLKTVLSKELGMDKSGIKNAALERIDSLEPGESKVFYYDINAKHSTTPGEHQITVVAEEHYRDYNHKKQEYMVNAEIRVE